MAAAAKKPTKIQTFAESNTPPHGRPIIAKEQAYALRALWFGEASPAEQGLAMRFITHKLGLLSEFVYRHDQRDHAFADGRRYVGFWIASIAQMTPEQMAELPELATWVGAGEDDEMPVF